MEDELFFRSALQLSFALPIAIFLGLTNITAPYGRHHLRSWRASLPTRLAWFLMELPALVVSLSLFFLGRNTWQPVPTALILFFLTHYFHRSIIYPLRIKPSANKNMPLAIAAFAFVFNLHNGYMQARSVSHYETYPLSWFRSVQFSVGAPIFVAGMGINIWADNVLVSVRKESKNGGYKIPQGWLFDYVTCPNYFGEILEWLGWAVMTWSAAGLAFWLTTLANLVPRAAAHHKWYVKTFPAYPRSRRILIPFLY